MLIVGIFFCTPQQQESFPPLSASASTITPSLPKWGKETCPRFGKSNTPKQVAKLTSEQTSATSASPGVSPGVKVSFSVYLNYFILFISRRTMMTTKSCIKSSCSKG